MRTKLQSAWRWLVAPAVGVVLLSAMAVQQLSYTKPADLKQYHARVQEAIQQVPKQLGPWTGSETEVPRSARELLSPNAILSREYHNANTGRSVHVMFVHVRDARDIAGHFPPNCYPSNGWTERRTQDDRWNIAGTSVPVRDYLFTMELPTGDRQMHVLNTLVLPEGRLTRQMSEVRGAAADYRSRFYGAGQIQVLMNHRMTPARRKAIFKRFFKAMRPAIEAMRAGIEQ